MKTRTKSRLNLISGVLFQVLTLIIGLFIPRLFILNYGSELNGIQSSVAYIYTYVALLESGIGLSTLQALFKPIKENDIQTINKILSATHCQFKRVAKWYFICMVLLSFLLPLTLNTSEPYWELCGIVFFTGFSSLLSFLFYSKFVLFLQANGQSFIVSTMTFVLYLLKNVVKIVMILCGYSIIYVYLGSACVSIFIVIIYYWYQKKFFPWINFSDIPDFKAISQSKNVLVHQITSIITNSTSVLVLTYAVKDLSLVSVYNVYCMIFDAIKVLILNIFSSVHFIMGQTYATNIEMYRKYHNMYEVVSFTVSFTLYSVGYVMILPFISIYTKGITDANYLDSYLPVLFVFIKLLSSLREPSAQLINYAGHFKKTQNRAIIEMVINLLVSIFASFFWGFYGVMLGSIVSLLYRLIDNYIYISQRFLNRSILWPVRQWIIYLASFVFIMIISFNLKIVVNNYASFFVCAICVFFVILIYYTVITLVFNRILIIEMWNILKRRK